MIPEYRNEFNQRFTPDKYHRAVARMTERTGQAIPFRIAESPIFIPASFLEAMERTSEEIIGQLQGNPDYWEAAERIIPAEYRAPNEDFHPTFLIFDYAVAHTGEGATEPRLIEMQGFPSLLAFQYYLSRDFQETYALAAELKFLSGGLSEDGFANLFRRAVLNGHAPEQVALVDVRPWEQSTRPDFQLTERLCPGLAILCPTDLRASGRRLYYRREGREIPLRRIVHRVVWEELSKVQGEMHFRYTDDVEMEWANHPNWFFKYSKFSLPYLRHPNVPKAYFLERLDRYPEDLQNYILKPLFSFSGNGLALDLDKERLDAVPAAERGQWILQEKVHYAEAIAALDGTVRCEIRLMYLWLDRPICAMTLPRMSRGRLMGCAYNKTEPWTGHGLGFFPTG